MNSFCNGPLSYLLQIYLSISNSINSSSSSSSHHESSVDSEHIYHSSPKARPPPPSTRLTNLVWGQRQSEAAVCRDCLPAGSETVQGRRQQGVARQGRHQVDRHPAAPELAPQTGQSRAAPHLMEHGRDRQCYMRVSVLPLAQRENDLVVKPRGKNIDVTPWLTDFNDIHGAAKSIPPY